MQPDLAAPAPVARSERVSSLDALRGFALLGILLMNILGFAMHFAAYGNPTVAGGSTGANFAAWLVMHVFAEGKMRCLFSLVFGASMILLTSRLEQRGGALSSADLWYRRILWLLVFGLAHAYLLWVGDILYPYALCGLALYPFRRMSARGLMLVAAGFIVLQSAVQVGLGFETRRNMELARQAVLAEKEGRKATPEQEEGKQKWEEARKLWQPSKEELEKDAQAWRGGFLQVMKERARQLSFWHGAPYYSPWHWDAWSMMFLGMAMMKLGVLSAARSRRFYLWLVVAGYAIGVAVNSYTASVMLRTGFDLPTRYFLASAYDAGRLSVAAAHMAVLMLLCQAGIARRLLAALAAVGQMAFSNYVLQSLICSTIFYGYGLGLYNRLERVQLYYLVAAIWLFQLAASPLWLAHFRFGPLEWAWRSLAYWKRQPLRLAAGEASGGGS